MRQVDVLPHAAAAAEDKRLTELIHINTLILIRLFVVAGDRR